MGDVIVCVKCKRPMAEASEFCSKCGAPQIDLPKPTGPMRQSMRPPASTQQVFVWAAAAVAGLIGIMCTVASVTKDDKSRKEVDVEPVAPRRSAPQRPKQADPIQTLLEINYLPEALNICRPTMGDTVNEPSVGGAMFAIWAARKMSLYDVKVPNETSFGAVKKDSAGERGKRMCFTGKIVEIAKSDNGQGDTIWEGKMFNSDFDIAAFYAAKETDGIAEGTKTRFCGVVSGRHSYSNSGGGTSHAVEMIGVFDIPANR